MGETASTFASAIANWTELVNGVLSIIQAQPIMITMLSIPLVGGAIGLIKRLV